MKKRILPTNWIEVVSKTHPDRVYYFNVKTNESSWEQPTKDEVNKSSGSGTHVPKKRKQNDESDTTRSKATTPDLDDNNSDVRPILVAKRRSKSSGSIKEDCDTPQMAEIREKLLQKRTKKTPSKNNTSLIHPQTLHSETTVVNSSSEGKTSVSGCVVSRTNEKDVKSDTLTPQMRAVLEKMQQKNDKKNITVKQFQTSQEHKANDTNTRVKQKRNRNRRRALWFQSNVNNNTKTNNIKNSLNKQSKDDSIRKATEYKECKNGIQKNSGSNTSKKNIAKERMDRLKKMLNSQTNDQKLKNKLIENCDESLLKIISSDESPDIYKTADLRHKNLRNRLIRSKGILQEDEMLTAARPSTQTLNSSQEDLVHGSQDDTLCEKMDWEPMEDEKITFEVQAARTQLCIENIVNQIFPTAENVLRIPPSSIQEEKKCLYIVIDTNVFLSDIKIIEKARDIQFTIYDRPILVIPWTVIRELDYLKDDKSKTRSRHLRAKARRAVNFLNEHFSSKHPRIVGQTSEDVALNKETFAAECPDDEILQACLQIRDAGRAVALLSYDKNLCNKAMIHDIISLGRDDPLEKIDYLSSSNMNSSFHDAYFQNASGQESQILSTFQEELRFSDELFEEVQSIIKECLSVIVSQEMKNLYGDTWEKYAIIKPPWTTLCVLKCAVKHWLAAISEAFDRHAESILKEVQQIFSNMPKGGRKLKDVAYLLEKCSDLTQMIKIDKYPNLMAQASNTVDKLRNRCQKYVDVIREKKLQDEIGTENDILEEKRRAEKAFKRFDDIFAYARDIGGMAANIVGIPCSFSYQVPNPTPTVECVKQIQPEVARNVHNLLHVLSTAVERMQNSSIDHRTLLDLYHTLTSFLPETLMINTDLTPLDVYCCLKQKEDVLKTGIRQFQELSTHFSRLANYYV